jgi:hypothetical protein
VECSPAVTLCEPTVLDGRKGRKDEARARCWEGGGCVASWSRRRGSLRPAPSASERKRISLSYLVS